MPYSYMQKSHSLIAIKSGYNTDQNSFCDILDFKNIIIWFRRKVQNSFSGCLS